MRTSAKRWLPSSSASRHGTFAATAIVDALKGRIANYKVPKRVFVVDDLPRNAMGKVQKNVLRERYKAIRSARAATLSRHPSGAAAK